MSNALRIERDTSLAFRDCLDRLVDMGYQRVSLVMEPGDMAVRGSIIDVFPEGQSHPIRLDYFGDVLERLNSFDLHTQRSLSAIDVTTIYPVRSDHVVSYEDPIEAETSDAVLSDICTGDYVVHEDYGIGRFEGLQRLVMGRREGEYAFIRYQGTDKLYVPIEKMGCLHPYRASDGAKRLGKLHDGSWARTRAKATKSAEEFVAEMYLMYQERQHQSGYSFSEDSVWQAEMESSFEHEDTLDQIQATAEIKADMESDKPMDRLLCGDVGFGKTEVLLRAVFKAIDSGKQVAILVPTTILADQHYHTALRRFSAFPFRIEALSRLKSKSEQKKMLNDLKNGKVDVVVGTHRLLNADVTFNNLGLLVIDEEQRFGVSHKEKIKHLKTDVDVLSVTATPIPRTLYFALTGARDLSVIETPPRQKKPVVTTVTPYHDSVAQKAILDEISNGGQVYYVFNEVRKMVQCEARLSRLCPGVRIGVAHGQLRPEQLEKVMESFYRREFDLLLCSTIVESGLDNPNVNTIVIEKAEKFGLSQIHQLRGRVGRGDRQGYAYLLYSQNAKLTDNAQARLAAIKGYAALGSGYKLAMRDLEIRGAGTLLGNRQHGHMMAVGFDLYCKLVKESSRQFRPEQVSRPRELEFATQSHVFIPSTYIESERERLAIYQRINAFSYPSNVSDLVDELTDRYGAPPKVVKVLLDAVKSQLMRA